MLKTLLNILFRKSKTIFQWSFLLCASNICAQEILLNVIIDDQQYAFPDRSIFASMKTDMENFVNNKIWTQDNFEQTERITCNLLLTVQKSSGQTNFSCQAQVQSSRPVYGAAYESVLLNFLDKNFTFYYTQGMQMEYNDNSYTTEITSLLAFYTYIILGMDYDSFSPNGGKNYYLLANQAMNNNPSASSNPGWQTGSNDPNTRYWLVENALNPQFQNFHQGLYDYHRIGLDQIAVKKTESQKVMLNVLKNIRDIKELNQTSILVSSFMLAKRDEIIAVFKGASKETKEEIITILRFLDPAYTEKYQNILK